jgi:long-subunit fatty acid transport protein
MPFEVYSLMDKLKKAQSSIELLMVISIALVILLPASIAFFDYAQDSGAMIVSSQINVLGNNLLTKVEEMYTLGSNSWTTIEISVPNEFINASIQNQSELFIDYRTPVGVSQAVFFSTRTRITNGQDVCSDTCNLNLTPGVNRIRIQSKGQNVSIQKR